MKDEMKGRVFWCAKRTDIRWYLLPVYAESEVNRKKQKEWVDVKEINF